MTCIGTWMPGGHKNSSSSSTINRLLTSSSSSSQDGPSLAIVDNSSENNSLFLALRDQKGHGECLEYRKIENSSSSLQVFYYSERQCFDPFHGKMPLIAVNVSWLGGCQEALMDAHAVSQSFRRLPGCLLTHLVLMLTVMLS